LQPPAGAGNVVTVFVPGLTENGAFPGALIITIPEPPEPPDLVGADGPPEAAPPPPPVLTVPAFPFADAFGPPPAPPPPDPPDPSTLPPV
jgi:hypothetical protein